MIRFRMAFVLLVLLATAPVLAQPGFGGGRGPRANPFGVGALLMSEEVRGEIELVDEQQAELREMQSELRSEIRGRMRELFAGMRDLSPEERQLRMQEVRDEMRVIRADVEERLKEVLMPQQFDRLKQIELQQQLRNRGAGVLAEGRLADELKITPEQQEQMRAKAAEVQATLQTKIAQLRSEAREEVLTILTPEQRAKLDALTGEQFDMPLREGRAGERRPRRRNAGRPRGDAGAPELE